MLAACAGPAHWPPQRAERPATLAELQAYQLSVYGPTAEERNALARALLARGFHVVDREPQIRRQLAVTLTREARTLVATLRSDDWFVDEALGATPEELAATLAVSERVATFIRNSGLPQQRDVEDH